MKQDEQVLAKLEYFRERTEKDLDDIKDRLDKLWEFRSVLLGGSIAVSSVVTFLVNLAFLYFESHK